MSEWKKSVMGDGFPVTLFVENNFLGNTILNGALMYFAAITSLLMCKLKTALYQFNRPVFALNIVLSLYLVYNRNIYNYPLSLFAKCCGYLVIVGYQYFSANKTFFYFRNAGYRIRDLYIYSILFDLLLFSILYSIPIIIYELIHA